MRNGSPSSSVVWLLFGTAYLLVSAMPCPPVASSSNPLRHPAAHSLHHMAAHSAQVDAGAADRASWVAPCPCGCGERGTASASGGKLGFALLISPATDTEARSPSPPLHIRLPGLPTAPFLSLEPIPI